MEKTLKTIYNRINNLKEVINEILPVTGIKLDFAIAETGVLKMFCVIFYTKKDSNEEDLFFTCIYDWEEFFSFQLLEERLVKDANKEKNKIDKNDQIAKG